MRRIRAGGCGCGFVDFLVSCEHVFWDEGHLTRPKQLPLPNPPLHVRLEPVRRVLTQACPGDLRPNFLKRFQSSYFISRHEVGGGYARGLRRSGTDDQHTPRTASFPALATTPSASVNEAAHQVKLGVEVRVDLFEADGQVVDRVRKERHCSAVSAKVPRKHQPFYSGLLQGFLPPAQPHRPHVQEVVDDRQRLLQNALYASLRPSPGEGLRQKAVHSSPVRVEAQVRLLEHGPQQVRGRAAADQRHVRRRVRVVGLLRLGSVVIG
mmetsp:Transcript_1385/g.2343  ORF Transcript_1385/g.2343 Transcript_1385/m.2343 type:complete len:266 (+) Transcript_1385:1221-2018(+)